MTTPITRMAAMTDLLLQGWQTPEVFGRELGLSKSVVSSMLKEVLWVGLPLECHRVGSGPPRYRLLDTVRDQGAAARSRTPSGSMALLVWELRRRPLSKVQIGALVGSSDRAIKRQLAAVREAGLPLVWSDRTSRGVYRGYRVYQIGRQATFELDGSRHRLRGLDDDSAPEGRHWLLEREQGDQWAEVRRVGLANDCGAAEAREAFGL